MCKYWMFLFFSNCAFSLTTLHVTQTSDNNPGGFGDSGDLRWCINTMNEGLNSSADDYVITFDFPMTIQLQGLLPIINNSSHPVNITIGPTGSIPTVIIDGDNGAYGGLFIPMGNVTIQNMTFQNLTAKGGDGGDGISGGGGGLGAGGAIYLPETFLNGSYPNVILKNVLMNNCSAVGGNGGNGINSLTGDEGGGGGGGFYGKGGLIEASGRTGGGGGGGFGGDGGNVTLSGGILGGGGGGGIGSKAMASSSENLGHGGSDQSAGLDGNGYGLSVKGGDGAGGYLGGSNAGGGGGGGASGSSLTTGGGGGGSDGFSGQQPLGTTPPGGSSNPSGGNGRDGGGGGGGAVVIQNPSNNGIDGKAGTGGYGGGGGGGAGTGSYETFYSVEGGGGGIGGGGGGGGVNFSGFTPANGGNSLGGGGGGGGGPSLGVTALGGADNGALGGGSGGDGSNRPIGVVVGYGGGGGGGGSALGPAIFVDSGLSLTIQAFDGGIRTNFNTLNNVATAGSGGNGGPNAQDGFSGSSLSAPIFLRSGAVLNLVAQNAEDLLILGEGVSFADDTIFGGGGSSIMVKGNGTVIYQGSTDYTGNIAIHNANLNLQGVIDGASVQVCRNLSIGPQRGMLSGSGTITRSVFVNSGAISPDEGQTLTLGSLQLSPANPISDTLGSLVHININMDGSSLVDVIGNADLHGVLEMEIAADTPINSYTIFSSSNLTGTFDQVVFTGTIPYYGLSYLPIAAPTYVQFDFLGFPSSTIILPTNGLSGNNLKVAQYLNELADDPNLGLNQQLSILEDLPFKEYEEALESISPSRIAIPTFAAQNVMFMLSEAVSFDLTKKRLARHEVKNPPLKEMALLASNDLYSGYSPSHRLNKTGSSNTSQIWTMGFGQFGHQNSQEQTPGFDFNSGGLFVAYDYGNIDQGYIGALSGYAHISIEDNQSQGSSELNAGYISLYGTGYFSDFFLDTSLWGQYMHVDQKRKIGYSSFTETATSDFNAAQFNVHMGMGYDFNRKTLTFEPFALADIVFEWDGSYQEKGTGPYNMQIDSRKSWMLRFETGFNGYKTVNFNHGVFIAQTKLSYVYKKPHNVGQVNAAIVNAPIGFSVESFSSCQNLVSPGIELFWKTDWNGYMSLSYNGEFGSGYRSNQFYGKIGYAF